MGTWETSSRCGSPRTKIRSGCVIASMAIRLGQMLAHSIKASRKGMEEAEAKLVKWHHSRPVACPETRTFLFVSSWNKLSEPPSPIERQRWRPSKRALPHIRHSCISRCDQTMKLRSPGLPSPRWGIRAAWAKEMQFAWDAVTSFVVEVVWLVPLELPSISPLLGLDPLILCGSTPHFDLVSKQLLKVHSSTTRGRCFFAVPLRYSCFNLGITAIKAGSASCKGHEEASQFQVWRKAPSIQASPHCSLFSRWTSTYTVWCRACRSA